MAPRIRASKKARLSGLKPLFPATLIPVLAVRVRDLIQYAIFRVLVHPGSTAIAQIPKITHPWRYRFFSRSIPKWTHEIQSSSSSTSDWIWNSPGNNFGRRPGESGPYPGLGPCDASVLLPLLVRKRRETLHKNVRAAAISKPLVGSHLPQESFIG